MTDCVIFWQRMLTPHMTELARQLALEGTEVHYVAEETLSQERREMGWKADQLPEITIHQLKSVAGAINLVESFPAHAVHITQGVRGNGLILHAQRRIALKKLRQYVIMEAVDSRGFQAPIKSLVYTRCFHRLADSIEGVLAIGKGTPEWIGNRSPRKLRVIPFAYFLKTRGGHLAARMSGDFRFIFVGSLIDRKRVDLLLNALSHLLEYPFILEVVGDGPIRTMLEQQAMKLLPKRACFTGALSMNEAICRIGLADCLVLPSDHDGWGAVVSEAQIYGTPAVCSSRCGVSGVVRASGMGGVFEAGNVEHLRGTLRDQLERFRNGRSSRAQLAEWAQCLTAQTGARYLLDVIGRGGTPRISLPWEWARR